MEGKAKTRVGMKFDFPWGLRSVLYQSPVKLNLGPGDHSATEKALTFENGLQDPLSICVLSPPACF